MRLHCCWLLDPWNPNREPYLEAWRNAGWPITLWHCGQLERAPVSGIEIADARPIIEDSPIAKAFEYEKGFSSHAPCADLFRYEVLLRHGGCYVDVDIVPSTDAVLELLEGRRLLFEYDALYDKMEIRFIAAPKGHELLRRLRDRAVDNTERWMAAGGYRGPEDLRIILERTGPGMAQREVQAWAREQGIDFESVVSRQVVYAETTVNRAEHYNAKWPAIDSKIDRRPFNLFESFRLRRE